MGKVGIPVITSNRINTPDVAEAVLAEGCADMVSMARPFLADADFVNKAAEGARMRLRLVSAAIRRVSIIRSRARFPLVWSIRLLVMRPKSRFRLQRHPKRWLLSGGPGLRGGFRLR